MLGVAPASLPPGPAAGPAAPRRRPRRPRGLAAPARADPPPHQDAAAGPPGPSGQRPRRGAARHEPHRGRRDRNRHGGAATRSRPRWLMPAAVDAAGACARWPWRRPSGGPARGRRSTVGGPGVNRVHVEPLPRGRGTRPPATATETALVAHRDFALLADSARRGRRARAGVPQLAGRAAGRRHYRTDPASRRAAGRSRCADARERRHAAADRCRNRSGDTRCAVTRIRRRRAAGAGPGRRDRTGLVRAAGTGRPAGAAATRRRRALLQQQWQQWERMDAGAARRVHPARRRMGRAATRGERASRRERYQAWQALPLPEQANVQAAATQFAAMPPERQQALARAIRRDGPQPAPRLVARPGARRRLRGSAALAGAGAGAANTNR